MENIKYTVRLNNGDITIKTFINGKLDTAIKVPDNHKTLFKRGCDQLGMTLEEGVVFVQRKMNRITQICNQQEKDLELMSTHNHR